MIDKLSKRYRLRESEQIKPHFIVNNHIATLLETVHPKPIFTENN
jgi:hypothetical protein